MSVAPATYNISHVAGDTYRNTFTLKSGVIPTAIDLTGCTGRIVLRRAYTDASPLLTCVLTLGGVLGTAAAVFTVPANATLVVSRCVWDLEITFSNGDVQTYLSGYFDILPGVS